MQGTLRKLLGNLGGISLTPCRHIRRLRMPFLERSLCKEGIHRAGADEASAPTQTLLNQRAAVAVGWFGFGGDYYCGGYSISWL
jgi:hypothetical protein